MNGTIKATAIRALHRLPDDRPFVRDLRLGGFFLPPPVPAVPNIRVIIEKSFSHDLAFRFQTSDFRLLTSDF